MENIAQSTGRAPGVQPKNGAAVEVTSPTSQPRHTLREYERLFGVDEEAYEQPTTTRKELWSYYLYYNGSQDLRPMPLFFSFSES